MMTRLAQNKLKQRKENLLERKMHFWTKKWYHLKQESYCTTLYFLLSSGRGLMGASRRQETYSVLGPNVNSHLHVVALIPPRSLSSGDWTVSQDKHTGVLGPVPAKNSFPEP